jgi:chromosomal replication initiation ATPase DnaA
MSRMEELKPFVQKLICEYFKTNWQLIEGPSREQKFVDARFAYCYIMVEQYKQSKKATGRDVKKHHTSVMHAINEVKGYIKVDDDYRLRINQIIKMLPQ